MTESYPTHAFDTRIAASYGVPAALIHYFISKACSKTATGWIALTLEDFYEKFPYLGEWQVWSALQKLTRAGRKTPALVLRKQVMGNYLYAPASKIEFSKKDTHWISVNIASKYGVVASVFYTNTRYWITYNWRNAADGLFETLDAALFAYDERSMREAALDSTTKAAAHYDTLTSWMVAHPYLKRRSVQRAIEELISAGELRCVRGSRGKMFWRLSEKALEEFKCHSLSNNELDNQCANTQSRAPKPKPVSQNPNQLAKSQTKQGLTETPSNSCAPLLEAKELEAESQKPFRKTDATHRRSDSQSSSPLDGEMAMAAGAAKNATAILLQNYREQVKNYNKPSVPVPAHIQRRDLLGNILRRQSTATPLPGDEDYDIFIEDLSPEERERYESRFRS